MNQVYAADAEAAAVDYRERGLSPIPIKMRSKAPKLPQGHPFLGRRATEEEFGRFDFRHNVAIVTGKLSKIIVLDDDDNGKTLRENAWHVPATPTVKTSRGYQYYLRCPEEGFPSFDIVAEHLEIKADRTYVLAPPSSHPSGERYEWVITPDEADFADPPEWLLTQARLRGRKMHAEDIGETISNGSRNKALCSIAGTLRRRGLDRNAIYAALLGINETTCETPLPDLEVEKIAASISRYAPEEDFYSSAPNDGVANERKTLLFKTARQVAQETPAEVDWIARPWLARGAITEVDGKIKAAGKTTFVSHKVACIVDGKLFMGGPTTKTKVVWLTEQSPPTFRKVLERANLTDRDDVLVVHWHDAIGMEWGDVARAATAKALEIGAGLLVVDTLGQFAGIKGDGENNAGAAQEAMKPLQEAAAKGLAVEFTRHERKGGGEVGESGRGSSAFGGAVDVIMTLRRGEGNTRPSVRIVEALSRFDETPDKVVIELTNEGYRNLGDASAFAGQEARQAIVELLPVKAEHAMVTADVLDHLVKQAIKRTVATEALATLAEAGTIERLGKGQKGSPYRYHKPTPENRPDDSESPDHPVNIHLSATPTYIRTNKKPLSDEDPFSPVLEPGEGEA